MDKNLTIRILGKGPTFEVTAETDNSSATGQLTLPPELLDLANMTRGMGGVSREAERETPVADAVRPDVRVRAREGYVSR